MVATIAQEVEVRAAHPSKTAMDGAASPVAMQCWASPEVSLGRGICPLGRVAGLSHSLALAI